MADPAEAELRHLIAGYVHDPLAFVLFAFPWGKKGTPLAAEAGPREWQRRYLVTLGDKLRAGAALGPELREAIRMARASGHGIGKSALVAWIVLWGISTREHTRGVVTANTDTQLRTKTWPEVRKWHALSINRHWFTCAATSIHAADPKLEKTWRIDAIPWSEGNTEAFAGLHNKGGRIILIFDEASAIFDLLWEVAEGAMTDEGTEIVWPVFGNPTLNTGRFRECFGRFAHRWDHEQIDSRTVEGTNKTQLEQWVKDYGEDSDFVRIRVRGVFPRAGTNQFIRSDVVSAAADARRKPIYNALDPVIVGVDVARFGNDESVICTRKGRDARSIPMQCFRGLDTMQLSARLAAHLDWLEQVGAPADAVFVDEGGIGGAVIDRMKMLGYRTIGVNNGVPSDETPGGILVKNKAAEQWVRMREWLGNVETGGALPVGDQVLCSQLESREFSYNDQQRVVLETKDDMAERGIGSPDRADALALTFAQNVGSHGQRRAETEANRERRQFDPLARVRR